MAARAAALLDESGVLHAESAAFFNPRCNPVSDLARRLGTARR